MQSHPANDQKTFINSTRQPIALKKTPTRHHSARKLAARVPNFRQISTTQTCGEKCGLGMLQAAIFVRRVHIVQDGRVFTLNLPYWVPHQHRLDPFIRPQIGYLPGKRPGKQDWMASPALLSGHENHWIGRLMGR